MRKFPDTLSPCWARLYRAAFALVEHDSRWIESATTPELDLHAELAINLLGELGDAVEEVEIELANNRELYEEMGDD